MRSPRQAAGSGRSARCAEFRPEAAPRRETSPGPSKVLASMPGFGVRIGARILIEVGDGSTFPTAGHLAAH
ncbi:transposase [Streptomyces sp. NBC_01717]|nr:transposase [Streptomyces sp. NBC_01717]